MIDAFTRAIRKPQQVLGYLPVLTVAQIPPVGTRLRREPDGPVGIKLDTDLDYHMPSPFRVGYGRNFCFSIIDLLNIFQSYISCSTWN